MAIGISNDFVGSTPGKPTHSAIPGYAILGVVRRGRTGVVYDARELRRDRRGALEVVESVWDRASGDDGRVELVADPTRLNNPNIVPVLAAGRHDGAQFVAY